MNEHVRDTLLRERSRQQSWCERQISIADSARRELEDALESMRDGQRIIADINAALDADVATAALVQAAVFARTILEVESDSRSGWPPMQNSPDWTRFETQAEVNAACDDPLEETIQDLNDALEPFERMAQ